MPPKARQHRLLVAILFALGALPFIAAAVVVASAFVMPSAFRRIVDLFVPSGVDAPDNWAVGISRMLWLLILCGSTGFVLCSLGLWLSRRAASRVPQ